MTLLIILIKNNQKLFSSRYVVHRPTFRDLGFVSLPFGTKGIRLLRSTILVNVNLTTNFVGSLDEAQNFV